MSKFNTLQFKIVSWTDPDTTRNQAPYTCLMSRVKGEDEWGLCKRWDPITSDQRQAVLAARGYVAFLADNGYKTEFLGSEKRSPTPSSVENNEH